MDTPAASPSRQSVAYGPPPVRGNVRLYFRLGDTDDYSYFAWFKSQGYDLYWGSAQPTLEMQPHELAGTSHHVDLPDDAIMSPEVASKVSYHRSGLIHHNTGGSGIARITDEFHGHPEQLTEMKLLNVTITAAPADLPVYQKSRSLYRNRSYALIIQLSEEQWKRRQYCEFYLSPPGPVTRPNPVFGQIGGQDEFIHHWFDVELGRVLAVRHAPFQLNENTAWHPRISLWYYPVGEPNVGTDSTGHPGS